MGFLKNKLGKIILSLGLIILILSAVFLGFAFFYKNKMAQKIEYVIPGVPYIGIYNHKDKLSYIDGSTASTLASIFEYWNPGNNDLAKIRQDFNNRSKNINEIDSVPAFINNYGGYKTSWVKLDFGELKKYTNPDQRTPLLIYLPLDQNELLAVNYRSAFILIGIKENEQKLIFHNYWLGNNYEINYVDFNKLEETVAPTQRNYYLVIQPENLNEKLIEIKKRPATTYPERTSMMNQAEQMFKNYATASNDDSLAINQTATSLYSLVISNSKFEDYFPPYFKVLTFLRLGSLYLQRKDYDNALTYTNKALELNHDLDKPFKDWPGWEERYYGNKQEIVDHISGPERVLGDIYSAQSNFAAAITAYQAALDIAPQNQFAISGLQTAEAELAKSTPTKK